jgi:hypothetical protein
MQRDSEMKAIRFSGVTSMHSLPDRTTGHDFLHSSRHFCLYCQAYCRLGTEDMADFWFALVVVSGSQHFFPQVSQGTVRKNEPCQS